MIGGVVIRGAGGGCCRITAATTDVRSAERGLTGGPSPRRSGQLPRGIGRRHRRGRDQHTTVAAVAVTCCSSRRTVGDRPDQHVTVVATAMACCRPWPSPVGDTRARRGGSQRCSIFAEPLSVPFRPRSPGNDPRCGSPAAPVRFCDHSRRSRPPRGASAGIRQHPPSGRERTEPVTMRGPVRRAPSVVRSKWLATGRDARLISSFQSNTGRALCPPS
jgi:hypothetical protein